MARQRRNNNRGGISAAPSATSLSPVTTPLIQRVCVCGSGGAAGLDDHCDGCRAERISRKATNPAEPDKFREPAMLKRLGAGTPLDSRPRNRMESVFGQSFGHVRIHADATGAQMSTELDAHAFTIGEHVAFGSGRYRPGTPVGDALLAHEMAHVVQQQSVGPQREALIDEPSTNEYEREADVAAGAAVARLHRGLRPPAGRGSVVRRLGGPSLQRCGSTPENTDQRSGTRLPTAGKQSEILTELDMMPPSPTTSSSSSSSPSPSLPTPTARVRKAQEAWDGIPSAKITGPQATVNQNALRTSIFTAIDGYLAKKTPKYAGLASQRVPISTFKGACEAAKILVHRTFGRWVNPSTTALTAAHQTVRTSHTFIADPTRADQNLFDASDPAQLTKAGIHISAASEFRYELGHVPGVKTAMVDHNFHQRRTSAERAFLTTITAQFLSDPTHGARRNTQLLLMETFAYARASRSHNRSKILLQSRVKGGLNTNAGKPSRYEKSVRWSKFRTCVHEYLHNLAHPAFRAATAGEVTLEGFTHMFTKEALVPFLPKAAHDRTIRMLVEGGDYGADPSVVGKFSNRTYGPVLKKAEKVRDLTAGPGMNKTSCGGRTDPRRSNAVRAAFFQGHVELIGLSRTGTPGPTAEPDQVSVPAGAETFAKLAVASGVPEAKIRQKNPGVAEPLAAGRLVILPGCREHIVVGDRDTTTGPVRTETRAQIAKVHTVSEADLDRANPGLTTSSGWGTLTTGQRILIPKR